MHYVKHFNINGVQTKQVACIELKGKPNAATEGYVGVLGIDITSPTHDVYKCVAVNGAIYTWELLTGEMPDMSNYYTKEEVDEKVVNVDLSSYYTKEEIDNKLNSIPSYPTAEGVSF